MKSPQAVSDPVALRVTAALTLPGLIRLVSEIDDHGPVGRGSLGVTFDDLSRHQLRQAIATARALRVMETADSKSTRYRLTEDGKNLAEVYDRAARWARTHQYPAPSSDFITRVQCTLQLLAPYPDTDDGQVTAPDRLVAEALIADTCAAQALEGLQAALVEWIGSSSHAVRAGHVTDGSERAA